MMLASGQDSGSGAIGLVLILGGIVAYWIPSVVALARHKSANFGPIIVINAFLGWTVVGWVVALAMACTRRRPDANGSGPPRDHLQFPPGAPPPPGYS